ncbi:hypothetical protein AMK59_2386 [Oryctes borbonicus]|uniref:Uncharacterized protein n=1 Tax=Oryctes borbonicus TaxID=1629725 RepID=A0A0T6BAC3_9SCAR|nr:hypothetical protein AMK59_2386 [Oryctes borbonicus]
MLPWKYRKIHYMIPVVTIFLMFSDVLPRCASESTDKMESYVDKQLINYVDEIFSVDKLNIMPGFSIESKENASRQEDYKRKCEDARNLQDVTAYFYEKWDQYIENHVLAVNMSETSRFLRQKTARSSFMAGFGAGFLAFALKKLLLPVFIGAQIVKSLLIAMFLPSILGSLGKLLGKGLSSVSGISGSSGGFGGGAGQPVEDFEFKDTSPYNNDGEGQDYTINDNSISFNTGSSSESPEAMNRFGVDGQYDLYTPNSNNYYIRQPSKKADYKVFHKIPPSSLLLTSYDPFYSPLLSRLDSVFQQLGLGESKSAEMEKCRERLVCMMYANPAKFAPYSNLVSAQLSRELNELRKPVSDNPEILRFFKYMKAAKDGQDGEECLAHMGCPMLSAENTSPAMLTTFKDINKLVQARKLRST